MTDGELIAFVGGVITKALAENSSAFGVIDVQQSAQPTQQGTNSGPTVYFEKLFDVDRGWPMTGSYLTETGDRIEYTEQRVETTIQIAALKWQDPTAADVVTASDIINYVNGYFTFPSILQEFRDNKCAILKVIDVRNPYFENDKNQFEAHPSFDLVVTHERRIERKISSITSVTSEIYEATRMQRV